MPTYLYDRDTVRSARRDTTGASTTDADPHSKILVAQRPKRAASRRDGGSSSPFCAIAPFYSFMYLPRIMHDNSPNANDTQRAAASYCTIVQASIITSVRAKKEERRSIVQYCSHISSTVLVSCLTHLFKGENAHESIVVLVVHRGSFLCLGFGA